MVLKCSCKGANSAHQLPEDAVGMLPVGSYRQRVIWGLVCEHPLALSMGLKAIDLPS